MARPAWHPSLLRDRPLVALLLRNVLGPEWSRVRNVAVRDVPVATADPQNVGNYSERRFVRHSVWLVADAARKRLGALQRAAAVGLLHRRVHRGPDADLDRTRDGSRGRQPLAA